MAQYGTTKKNGTKSIKKNGMKNGMKNGAQVTDCMLNNMQQCPDMKSMNKMMEKM